MNFKERYKILLENTPSFFKPWEGYIHGKPATVKFIKLERVNTQSEEDVITDTFTLQVNYIDEVTGNPIKNSTGNDADITLSVFETVNLQSGIIIMGPDAKPNGEYIIHGELRDLAIKYIRREWDFNKRVQYLKQEAMKDNLSSRAKNTFEEIIDEL
jgi:hypothetical protein